MIFNKWRKLTYVDKIANSNPKAWRSKIVEKMKQQQDDKRGYWNGV
jgi:hypothetical protein